MQKQKVESKSQKSGNIFNFSFCDYIKYLLFFDKNNYGKVEQLAAI